MKIHVDKTPAAVRFLAAALVLGFFVWLCGRWGAEKRLTIAIHQGVEGAALKKVAQRFTNEYKIPVEVVEFPYDELYEREQSQLSNRSSGDKVVPHFDVLMVDDPWLPALLINKEHRQDPYRLQELHFNQEQLNDLKKDFFKTSLDVARNPYCEEDDAVCNITYYGVPFVGNSQLFCYRQSVFPTPDKVPATWEQVAIESHKIESANQGLGYVTRIGPGNSIVTDFLPILWSYDAKSLPVHFSLDDKSLPVHFSPQDFVLHDPQAATQAFQTLVELVGERNLNSASLDDFDVSAYLAKDRASMGVVWSAWAMMLAKVEQKNGRDELRCTDIPRDNPEPGTLPVPELGTWLLAIASNSELKGEAEEFIRYATSEKQLRLAAADGNPPPRRSVLEHPNTSDIPSRFFAAQFRALEHARPRPRTVYWREMEAALGEHLVQLVWGSNDVSEAVTQAKLKLESLLAKEWLVHPPIKGLPAQTARK